MAKEISMYEAKDGTLFKTGKGANNHDKKDEVKKILEDLNMTKEEVSNKLQIISNRNFNVKAILNNEPDWTKWYIHHIKMINKSLFKEPEKKTEYIIETSGYKEVTEEVLFEEKGELFADPRLHCKDEYELVKVVDSEFTRKVYYKNKYTWDELIIKKINNKEKLNLSDVRDMLYNFDVVYEDEGEDRRWSKSMLSVIDIDGKTYAIEWEKGLTESQPDEFQEQPYEVELETKEIIVTKTFINRK